MREILSVAAEWARAGEAFAVATLVGVRGSGPRELGASMIVSADGRAFGNVSGGCVEGAVFTECQEALETGRASLQTYGISDGDALAVGLTCGGIVDVLVRPVLPGSDAARDLLLVAERDRAGLPVAVVLEIPPGPGAGPRFDRGDMWVMTPDTRNLPRSNCGPEGLEEPPEPAEPAGLSQFNRGEVSMAGRATRDLPRLKGWGEDRGGGEAKGWGEDAAVLSGEDGGSYLVIPFGSAPRLIVVGAVEFSVALARLGAALGFAVTVVDPRDVFASPERFPQAEVVVDWPDRYLRRTRIDAHTAICVLSHDPRFDVPALRLALASPAGYVGAMGSRRTHDDRLRRLGEAGVAASAIDRLRSPIGLDLGGRTPDETALSILAEIVAVRHGASGRPLRERDGPVHAPVSSAASLSAR
ncbi:XdhC family protein [Microbacterium sp. No. 7]|uniref:XdhC family protein n=1 Tax=Microbacterium sp. No. 7 TaxID=1714373 RepID=UPI0006D066D2|nr:XdhC/CoxI family protein [Microbacterium sp. No. 7]ALJ22171.1 hypothetical protein AOA12_20710 [Microbacterium sp. No. 7]